MGRADQSRKIQKNPIPIIRRFSGGGTVVVDENTLFVSFIFQKEAHPFPIFPESILRWTEGFYSDALKLPGFQLKANDYAIGEKKSGGNAQFKKRSLAAPHHHFYYGIIKKRAHGLCAHTKKTPEYRAGRSHDDFLCKLCESIPTKENFIFSIKYELDQRFALTELNVNELSPLLQVDHRKSISLVDIPFSTVHASKF